MAVQSDAAKSAIKTANQALREARNRLIAAHQEEYDTYLKDERVLRGLPAISNKGGRMTLAEKVAKQRDRLAELERQLQAESQQQS